MDNFTLKSAVGKYVIIEPAEKSTILQTEETATVFRVVSVGDLNVTKDFEDADLYSFIEGDLIIVAKSSVEKTYMGDKEIYFVRDTDIIATVQTTDKLP